MKKLLPRTTGPYRVDTITDSVVTVKRDGVAVPVSIDRVTKIPTVQGEPVQKQPTGAGSITPPVAEQTPTGLQEDSSVRLEPLQPDTEFVIDKIVGHRDTPTGMEYKVRWYGYSPSQDTFEPADGLPQHFIARCWERKRRAPTRTRRRK